MRCDQFERLLHRAGGLPERARAHARRCPRCAAELRAAEAVEASLREPPPRPSAGFTDAVMARVLEIDRSLQAAKAPAPRPGMVRWLLLLAEEPVAAAGLVLLPVLLALGILSPGTLDRVVVVEGGWGALAAGFESAAGEAARALASAGSGADETARLAIQATLIAAVLALGYAAPVWMAGVIARGLAGPTGRRESRKRRRP